jgi:hypothetical protein
MNAAAAAAAICPESQWLFTNGVGTEAEGGCCTSAADDPERAAATTAAAAAVTAIKYCCLAWHAWPYHNCHSSRQLLQKTTHRNVLHQLQLLA